MARKKKTQSRTTRPKSARLAHKATQARTPQRRKNANRKRKIAKRRHHSHAREKNIAGGSATAAGINFQAAVTACVATHIATGEALRWLVGIAADVPTALTAETVGPGDDIQIITADDAKSRKA